MQSTSTLKPHRFGVPSAGKMSSLSTKHHDKACAQLHFNIRSEVRVKLNKGHWYGNVPKSVQKSNESTATILWAQQV